MANRYANLIGSNKIKDEYTKINAGFEAVQAEMDAVNAELDQKAERAFAQVNDLIADTKADTLTIEGGTGIIVTTNPNTKTVNITATGEAIPGPHGSEHLEFGADPIPLATPTEGGLMPAEDKKKLNEMTNDVDVTIYVSTTGDDGNDGLSPDTPFATIQKAIDFINDHAYRLAMGTWKIKIASGTYDGAAFNKALHPKNRIIIEGEVDESGIPTVIVDGTNSMRNSGLEINVTNYVTVKDMKFTNWTTSSTSCGLVASNGVNLYAVNVHADNITWAGININYNGRLYVEGGIVENCGTGIRVYDNCGFTIGYKGSETKRVIVRNCDIGIEPRNASQGHIDYTDISNCRVGIYCYNMARFHLMGSSVKNCTQFGVQINTGGTWFNSTDVPNVFSGNAKNEIRMGYGTELSQSDRVIYDPNVNQFVFRGDGNANTTGNSNCRMIVSSSGVNGINIISGETDSSFLYFGTTSNSAKTGLQISNTANYLELRVNGVNVTRIQTTDMRPVTDNAINLGAGSARWKEIYAATGTINTSDGREKQQIRPLNEAERAVALRLKGLIKAFKFNDAVQEKGDKARIHFGVIAQEVKAAFEAEGLNAEDYALFCYEEWPEQPEMRDKEGNIVQEYRPAGSRYGIRYDELLAFILAAI